MPFYDYHCESCDRPFDIKATVAEYEQGLNTDCPWCESEKTKRSMGGVFFVSSSPMPEPVQAGPSGGCSSGLCGLG